MYKSLILLMLATLLIFSSCNKVVLEGVADWQGDFFGASTNFFTDLNGKCANVVAGNSRAFAVSNSNDSMYMVDFSMDVPAVVSTIGTGDNPSRTTIDDKGRIWVGNRSGSSATCAIVNDKNKLEYCFSPSNIPTGGGPRTVTAQRIDGHVTNVYIGAHDGSTFLTRIQVTGTQKPFGKVVESASVKLLSSTTAEVKGYGGVFSQDTGTLWVSDRSHNALIGINNLTSKPFAPKVATEINLAGICPGSIYGIGSTVAYQLPLGGCLGGGIFQTLLNGDGSYSILTYAFGGKRVRAVSGDINGYAWATMDTSDKVGRVKLGQACADQKISLKCNASGTGQVCSADVVTNLTPAAGCVIESDLPGAKPLGVSASRSGEVFVVGHNDATIYRYNGNASSISYDKSAKFSTGTAYMYSDFTGFSTGYVAAQEVGEAKCFEKPIELIAARYSKQDARNAITVKYFCADTITAVGEYKDLPNGDRLKDCVEKKCINVKVAFEGGELEESSCATQLSSVELKYKLVGDEQK